MSSALPPNSDIARRGRHFVKDVFQPLLFLPIGRDSPQSPPQLHAQMGGAAGSEVRCGCQKATIQQCPRYFLFTPESTNRSRPEWSAMHGSAVGRRCTSRVDIEGAALIVSVVVDA